MIAVNPLKTKVLITTDEVIFHGPVDNNPDVRILLQSIIIAERRLVLPLLGSVVYQKLIDAKNTLVTDDNKEALQNDFDEQQPPAREAVILQAGDFVNSESFLSSTQQALWRDHLHKIVAECVVYVAAPANRTRFTGQGMMKNSPDTIGNSGTAASIALFEMRELLDRTFFYRLNPLVEAMHEYLCKTAYPDYSRKQPALRKNPISLAMYEDEDDEKCNCQW